ncbi:amidophosphoribosyltransferase [Holotrichia oblita]|nr:amidophosphoribosyltransferase [Holotrichia oblita]
MINDKLKEECGVFGFFNNNDYNVAKMIYYGLYALQHRGQESCGICVNNDGHFLQHKDMGLVNEVFDNNIIEKLKGGVGIGHVRYAAKNNISRENAQPLMSIYKKGTLAIAHNGNIVNAGKIREQLELGGAIFQSENDTELILHLAAKHRVRTGSIEGALCEVMKELVGAYSFVLMSPRKLIAIRDPNGFRPLCIGKLDDSYVISSESAGLDVIQAEFIRDVEPGEIVVITKEKGLQSFKSGIPAVTAHCIFEYVYFARPDSVIDGCSVHKTRVKTGKMLANIAPVPADIVIGVPDSGLSFAVGYAEESGVPYGEGLVRNRYTGRTFIKPSQGERESAVNIKLNVLRANIEGKRVIMIDDSIVRGTTSKNIINLLKKNGAKEVHMRVASPKFLYPCYFGTDVPDKKELLAVNFTTEEICKRIGADSLAFLSIDSLSEIGLKKDGCYCKACFDGKYPCKVD